MGCIGVAAEHVPALLHVGTGDVDLKGMDSINAARGVGWDVNPWVWVIEFRRIE